MKRSSTKICIDGKMIKVDDCIVDEIYKWMNFGFVTLGSCCGHGKYPKTIVVKDNRMGLEVFSGKIIPRKKRFYRKDKNGFYYIPEAIKTWHKEKKAEFLISDIIGN